MFGLGQNLGQDVNPHVNSSYKFQLKDLTIHVLMREVILNVNVFGPIMKFGIFGYTNT
jgi:hypothetical protein